MKIALIQTSLVWENPAENWNLLEEKIRSISEKIDLIVLPEMFTTGFSMRPDMVFDTMDGETITWLQSLAKSKDSAITGSLVIKENDSFYNRLVFVFPSGEIQFYDKKHLFTLAGEDKVYASGKKRLIIKYKGFKICPLICYDLRFPVFSRNTEDYDLLIYVANWPNQRIMAWDSLLKARAIENMCYTIGVNRVGVDSNNLEYNGHSQCINPLGEYVLQPQEKEGVYITIIDKDMIVENRAKFGFLNDRDSFTVLD